MVIRLTKSCCPYRRFGIDPPCHFVDVQGAPLHIARRYLHRHRLPLTWEDETLAGTLASGMHHDALIASPDLHRALAPSHMHDATHPFPAASVAGALPADEAVAGHLALLPQIWRQGVPAPQPPPACGPP